MKKTTSSGKESYEVKRIQSEDVLAAESAVVAQLHTLTVSLEVKWDKHLSSVSVGD